MMDVDVVYLGDVLENINKICDGSVDFVVTDPPYEVDYNKKSQELEKMSKIMPHLARKTRNDQIERDKSFVDKISSYDDISREIFRILKKDSHVFMFCGERQIVKWSDAMIKAGFKAPQILVWKKNRTTLDMTMGYKFPENKEFILFFHKGWKKLNGWSNERHLFRSVLEFNSSDDTGLHSCAKPIDLLSFLIKVTSNVGDIGVDLFAGSGNHLVAMKRLNRRFIGFEISEEYYKTIISRLEFEDKQTSLFGFV